MRNYVRKSKCLQCGMAHIDGADQRQNSHTLVLAEEDNLVDGLIASYRRKAR
jgi:hypothetical protein